MHLRTAFSALLIAMAMLLGTQLLLRPTATGAEPHGRASGVGRSCDFQAIHPMPRFVRG